MHNMNREVSATYKQIMCRTNIYIKIGAVDEKLCNARHMPCRNPKALIQVEPKLLVDQKNRKAVATGGDILLANGQRIPLPGGFELPTTGLWSNLLDIPEVHFLQTLTQNPPFPHT